MPLEHKGSGLQVGRFLTHEELFGWRSRPEDFNAELSRFPSDLVLRLCCAVNFLLFGWSSHFDKNLHDRLVDALCPTALPSIKRTPLETLFHRQVLLLVAKEALRHGPNTCSQPTSPPDMTLLFTMANDQLATTERPTEEGARNAVELISRFLSLSEFQFQQPAIKLSRAYVMLAKLAELVPEKGRQFNIPQMFEQATGLPPEIYFPLVMASMTKYAPSNFEQFFRSPGDFALGFDWFRNTSVDAGKLQRFFDDMSGDYAKFQQLLRRFDRGVSDFTIFRECPIIHLGNGFFPVDFAFLAAKSESAFFWRAQSSLPVNERSDFHAFWGSIFERYMHRLLKSVDGEFNQYYESPRYADRDEEVCDGIVLCKGYAAVFMEFKGSLFRADAKWGGDVSLLERELRTKLIEDDGERKGVTQLANAISNVFERKQKLRGIDLGSVTKVYPVVVTYDEIGDAWFLASYLKEAFRKAVNRKKTRVTVAPPFCMSADHLEALIEAFKCVALNDFFDARYKQDRDLRMSCWLPNNAALKDVKWGPSTTMAEGFEELKLEARRLFADGGGDGSEQ
jgi:hypothetical protein